MDLWKLVFRPRKSNTSSSKSDNVGIVGNFDDSSNNGDTDTDIDEENMF